MISAIDYLITSGSELSTNDFYFLLKDNDVNLEKEDIETIEGYLNSIVAQKNRDLRETLKAYFLQEIPESTLKQIEELKIFNKQELTDFFKKKNITPSTKIFNQLLTCKLQNSL